MSCSRGVGGYSGGYNDCVKDVVKQILDAQRKASEDDVHSCATSCERSIDDLLSPHHHHRPHRYNTIPFMLISKDCNKPFVGSGFTSRRGRRGERRDHFRCIESPIFKVKGFQRGSDNCVTLELLEPIYRRGGDGEDFGDGHHDHHSGCDCSICKGFGGRDIANFCYTGVCITVDLDCFCGISCLDPIRPESMYD